MSHTPDTKPEDHRIATAIGKTLGTIAKTVGIGPSDAPAPTAKKRLPRKLKKELKKKAMAAEAKKAAAPEAAAKKTVAKKPAVQKAAAKKS